MAAHHHDYRLGISRTDGEREPRLRIGVACSCSNSDLVARAPNTRVPGQALAVTRPGRSSVPSSSSAALTSIFEPGIEGYYELLELSE